MPVVRPATRETRQHRAGKSHRETIANCFRTDRYSTDIDDRICADHNSECTDRICAYRGSECGLGREPDARSGLDEYRGYLGSDRIRQCNGCVPEGKFAGDAIVRFSFRSTVLPVPKSRILCVGLQQKFEDHKNDSSDVDGSRRHPRTFTRTRHYQCFADACLAAQLVRDEDAV